MKWRLVLSLVACVACGACGAAERAAAQDPMKCERDPKCGESEPGSPPHGKKRVKSDDCTTQCNDDPACMDRCEQVSHPNGPLGH